MDVANVFAVGVPSTPLLTITTVPDKATVWCRLESGLITILLPCQGGRHWPRREKGDLIWRELTSV